MEFRELFLNENGSVPKQELTILGVNPLLKYFKGNEQLFADMLTCAPNLKIKIIYESPTENFNQAVFYDKELSKKRTTLDELSVGNRNNLIDSRGKSEFVDNILSHFDASDKESVKKRITILQNNMRHDENYIVADNVIRTCPLGMEVANINLYRPYTAESDPDRYDFYYRKTRFFHNDKTGGLFLSKPGEELIQAYDKDNEPRGILPRKAFYQTDYQRYSVWVFIFNRKGQLLLHKRSEFTADNRSLWDKSAGGHVDIKDRSTVLTAKREVVEELFMPEAEFSPYLDGKLSEFIDFGEWSLDKRPENCFISDFEGLGEQDWAVFRPIDKDTLKPITIKRQSPRKMHVADKDENGNKIPLLDEHGKQRYNAKNKPMFKEHVETWYTRFLSDVYLMIAPENCIDTEEQMKSAVSLSETRGAASAHRLINIDELKDDNNYDPEKYTDDVRYMLNEYDWVLSRFSAFIKYIFKDKQ